jgi:D-aminopeptidase
MKRRRLRELGVITGSLPTGRWNAITDVAGVRVGYSTLVRDSPSIVRSGVTAIWPRGPDTWNDAAFAGVHSFNGYGEMTGICWIAEQGLLNAPICITNTYSVGVVRDAVCALGIRDARPRSQSMPLNVHLPVVAETYDGFLSDIESLPISTAMAFEALESARSGAIEEGNVGGGTGMVCHEFKGGTGSASRIVPAGYTVGVLVQANYGRRDSLRIDGAPVGREISLQSLPSPWSKAADAGSIIIIIATDAPLLPIQCQRLARRATTGLAWVGGIGANSSGDIFLAFSTANHVDTDMPMSAVTMLAPEGMTALFQAAAEATEEAILNALSMAQTMSGRDGRTAHALPLDLAAEIVKRRGASQISRAATLPRSHKRLPRRPIA